MFNSFFILHFNLAYLYHHISPCQCRGNDCKPLFEVKRSRDEETLLHTHKHPLAIIPAIFNAAVSLRLTPPLPPPNSTHKPFQNLYKKVVLSRSCSANRLLITQRKEHGFLPSEPLSLAPGISTATHTHLIFWHVYSPFPFSLHPKFLFSYLVSDSRQAVPIL